MPMVLMPKAEVLEALLQKRFATIKTVRNWGGELHQKT